MQRQLGISQPGYTLAMVRSLARLGLWGEERLGGWVARTDVCKVNAQCVSVVPNTQVGVW